MNNRHRIFISALAAGIAATLGASAAQAADVYLRAESFTKALPTNAAGTATQDVTMWGYSSCTDASFATCSAPASPGPEITVPPGDTSLTIHLQNNLPEPTSVMIPGQNKAMTPRSRADGQGRQRVEAFDAEAATGGGTQVYTWDSLRPGTYLYQSGTFLAKQVQMGLYGAMVHDTAEVVPPATAITLLNASFESPDCTTGCTVDTVRGNWTTSATDWVVTGTAGVFKPISSGPPGISATDGVQVGFSNGGTLTQTLTGTGLVANKLYTLTVDVGDRADSGFPGYTISLYAGDAATGTLLARDNSSQSPTSGWAESTITYQSGATVPAGDLTIVLTSAGGQTEFDNVRLSFGDPGPCGGASCAYVTPAGGVPYDRSKVVLFSEIDPALHDPEPKAANLTPGGYEPRFFLVNGQPFVEARAVSVTNASFEAPDCTAGAPCTVDATRGNYTTSAAGWTVTGPGGVFVPNASGLPAIGATDGSQVGWSSGGSLTQALGEAVSAGTTYTLSVDVGDRADANFPGYTVALYAGGNEVAASTGAAGSVTSGWAPVTVTYTAASGDAAVGQPLEVRLISAGSQTEFDNVRVFASSASTAAALVGSPDLLAAATGERVLLRMLNAGLQSRAPQLLGGYYQMVAEDGHPAPVRRMQYNTLLPAGKALDVLFVPENAGTYSLYDRRLGLVNGGGIDGGQLGHIVVTP